MIAFAPIVDLPPPPLPPPQIHQGTTSHKMTQSSSKKSQIFEGSTECSYLLMFFVMGVIALSIKDMSLSR